jgi:hypothetical protein
MKIPTKTVSQVTKKLNKIDKAHESKIITKAEHDRQTTIILKEFNKYITERK